MRRVSRVVSTGNRRKKCLFGNVETLKGLSDSLLKELHHHERHTEDVMVDFIPYFALYIDYCDGYESAGHS